MNNFRFYVQEIKKLLGINTDYSIGNIFDGEIEPKPKYLVPVKVSSMKKKSDRKSVVMVHRNSSAYDYFQAEYRQNRMSQDGYGNVLVPENDYFLSHKSR